MPEQLTLVVGVDAVVPGAFWTSVRDLADRLGAAVHVVHVLQATAVPAAAAFPVAGTGAPPLVLSEDLVETEQLTLDRLREACDPAWEVTVERGLPGQALLEVAQRVGAWGVVVGAPGHGVAAAVEHTLTGSTARYLEKHTTVPLVVLPAQGSSETW